MTFQIAPVMAILALTVALFVTEWLGVNVVALLVLAAPNIQVADALLAYDLRPFRLFDFSPVGVVLWDPPDLLVSNVEAAEIYRLHGWLLNVCIPPDLTKEY